MWAWQRAKNYVFRPFGRERQFTAIYDVRQGRGSFEGNAGLDETRHGTPPPLKIRRRWRITFTLDDSMESRDRAEGRGGAIFYELLASSKFVWMPSGHPGRWFFLARQELGSA